MQLLSPDPARRAVERYWLRFTPAWGAVAAVVMLSGAAERWGDLELMLLGVGMALGAVLPPLFFERERPFLERAGVAMSASIVTVAFAMNYLCTPYFFDVLHMHYGFRAEIAIENNPVFLYFMTVAYFATYCALLGVALRASARLGWLPSGLGAGLACFAVAFLETVLNSNPFMQRLFCFDDMPFMLWFGTLSYGLCFVCMLPAWMGGDDPAGRRVAFGERMLRTAGGMAAIVVVFAALRHGVAPHVTTVVPGSRGLRDGGCLSAGGGVQPSAIGANEGR
jgi:cycloeucalenol cycloisomerase